MTKLATQVGPETVKHLLGYFIGKRLRQRERGYGGMTATNYVSHSENLEKFPTYRAA